MITFFNESTYPNRTQKIAQAVALGGLSVVLSALPAKGAERIQFFYGPFEPTIQTDDLQHLADTGEVKGSVEAIANHLNPEQLVTLQSFLSLRFEMSPVMVSQFTYSDIGEHLLKRAGEVVQTESFLNGDHALRAALIFAAEDEEGLSIMNIIDQFPQRTIQINFPLAMDVLNENKHLFQASNPMLEALHQRSAAQAIAVSEWPDPDPRMTGQYDWKVDTFEFQNPARTVSSLAHLYRPIIPEASAQSTPVIVVSHGMASSYQSLIYLATHLAAHGYAVVFPEHPQTTPERFAQMLNGLAMLPKPSTLVERPRDITAVLDTLDQQAQTRPSWQTLNLESVGVMGQSLGGYTALAAAGAEINRGHLESTCQEDTLAQRPTFNLSVLLQCRFAVIPQSDSLNVQDLRVKAAIALNPITSKVFNKAGLSALDRPTLILSSLNDYFVPALPEQIEPFDWLQNNDAYLITIESGTHFSTLSEAEEGQGALPLPDFLLGPEPLLIQPPLQAVTLAFFDRYLLQEFEAETYLNQTYLNTFSTEPFQLNIIRQVD
ncbi:MAG: alpha/beta hydrolase [Cyanobacteria bacterium P01_A01_bin.17]